LQIEFKGGYFGAIINIILAILGIALLFLLLILYLSFNESPTVSGLAYIDKIPLVIIGFGFGASFVAMFAQLGGGIYTKAADVGADLIGKISS
jgi:Na+/H+-translocating membrane pyrophosphatase